MLAAVPAFIFWFSVNIPFLWAWNQFFETDVTLDDEFPQIAVSVKLIQLIYSRWVVQVS